MTRSTYEVVLFALLAINAALLTFIADVLRKIMNEMSLGELKRFVDAMVRHSSRSPFMLVVLNVPLFVAIPYCYVYGFSNHWLVAGLALWLFAGSVAKAMKLPVYKRIAASASDASGLALERKKLSRGNVFQAVLNVVAVVLAGLGCLGR